MAVEEEILEKIEKLQSQLEKIEKKEEIFIEHNPCLIVFDKLCLLLAPRIESGDKDGS